MKIKELIEMHGHKSAYDRDYDSSISGMGVDHEFRNRERNAGLEHERNHIAVYINGKLWKVFSGKGYADSREERQHLENMRKWAERKSAATGKKWTVGLTGREPTVENVAESATAGATSSANITSVPNPDYANNANKKPVKSVNALDQNAVSLFGAPMETMKNKPSKKVAIIKRR